MLGGRDGDHDPGQSCVVPHLGGETVRVAVPRAWLVRRRCGSGLLGLWSAQLARLAAHGDRGAYLAFARDYHLMASPAMLFNPAVIPPPAAPPYAECRR
jgi:hypothetical protein